MPFGLEVRPEERLVITVVGADFEMGRETDSYVSQIKSALDQMNGLAINVVDARSISLNFGDLTGALGMLTHGDMAVLRHPNLHAVVIISDNPLVSMGVRALGQSQYGAVKALVAPTLEEGIALARQTLGQKV